MCPLMFGNDARLLDRAQLTLLMRNDVTHGLDTGIHGADGTLPQLMASLLRGQEPATHSQDCSAPHYFV